MSLYRYRRVAREMQPEEIDRHKTDEEAQSAGEKARKRWRPACCFIGCGGQSVITIFERGYCEQHRPSRKHHEY